MAVSFLEVNIELKAKDKTRRQNKNAGKKLGNKIQSRMKFQVQNMDGVRSFGVQNPSPRVDGLAAAEGPITNQLQKCWQA